MKRRGQLTLFLAVGVVVIFSFVLVFILASQVNNSSILTVNENVPPAIISYIENTLEDACRAAVIETIAPQSGYQDPTSAKNQQPTEFYGKGLEMNFEKEYVRYQTLKEFPYPEYPYTLPAEAPPHPVVYYYVLGKFNIPSLGRIQKELLAETEKRFNERLDMSIFEDQYYELVLPDHEPVITLNINLEDISVDLHYPLEVLTEDQRAVFPNMTVNLPLRLNRTYELATCLVNRVVFDEGRDTYDPFDEAPDGDAFQECKEKLELDDYFTARMEPFIKDSEFKGRFVAVIDSKTEEDTGVPFEFQYLIWKCSGNFYAENGPTQMGDEQQMRVCEYACAKGVPEAVALGIAEVESGSNHFELFPTTPKKSSANYVGLMMGRECDSANSIIDGHPLNESDLEDNAECGANKILRKLEGRPDINNNYCCPSSLGGYSADVMAGPGEHICCQEGQENHECCANPYDLCCGFPTGHVIFNPCGFEKCDVLVGYDPDTGDPIYERKKDEVCGYAYKPECCDPLTPAGEDSLNNAYGGCCGLDGVDYGIPNFGYGATYGDIGNPEPDWPIVHPLQWSKLTKDATYDSWDLAIRGYYGWLCDNPDPGSPGIGVSDVQNYVESVHEKIKSGDEVLSRFLYNAYPTDPKYSLCHSYNRPEPEVSSTETGLTPTWPSEYIGLMDCCGVNPYGCCCEETSQACMEPWRLDGS